MLVYGVKVDNIKSTFPMYVHGGLLQTLVTYVLVKVLIRVTVLGIDPHEVRPS